MWGGPGIPGRVAAPEGVAVMRSEPCWYSAPSTVSSCSRRMRLTSALPSMPAAPAASAFTSAITCAMRGGASHVSSPSIRSVPARCSASPSTSTNSGRIAATCRLAALAVTAVALSDRSCGARGFQAGIKAAQLELWSRALPYDIWVCVRLQFAG